MEKRITISFPHLQKEIHERRAFLPEFIQFLTRYADVYLAEGYGSRMGFEFNDYRQGNPHVIEVERNVAFKKDYVMILRSPIDEEFTEINPGSCLISMLHYQTRPARVCLLAEHKINAISLDSIIDDKNLRLVENMRSVAWNGIETAFDYLEQGWPGLEKADGQPFRTLIIGTGMVGKHAVEAATKFGSFDRNYRMLEKGQVGSIALSIGRNITTQIEVMKNLMTEADILVDATQRSDSSRPLIPNAWLDWLPEYAVVTDLAVDPYLLEHSPIVVRGIEGIPQGNLDQYLFLPNDPNWTQTIPASIPSSARRTTITCYSWPGIHPEACMEHYARQLEPLMETLLTKGYENLTLHGGYFERALARAKPPLP